MVAKYGPPTHQIARDVEQALSPFLGARRLEVAVEDIVGPGDSLDSLDLPAGGRVP